jgi:hypothetical protein
MRTIATLVLAAVFAASPVFAQTKIKGDTEIKAKQENVAAVAVGKDNVAKNTAGAIKGNTRSRVIPRSRPSRRMQQRLLLARATPQPTKLALSATPRNNCLLEATDDGFPSSVAFFVLSVRSCLRNLDC